ncbi:ABC transporter substrate-binding protein [Pseudonocardia sp. KRD-184]|uniref:ABC transporter substrate-binding protein n=1 Tax=Pseudonocardia oceani TaxID=2792013 RepID=A0ABS6U573_9PSEU|nr:ABC transporter substrate-binding protein [Pseudonocardia oceani]MBW0089859.1 ABC transporter substrate-binding protein [Pseudonocardia oceani]MBW0097449.1 ABC transporter substrate-binding protein [Pseudonocardia oceani]MBW0123771.1 ABC transporter substrate-binding protein [Pseudonocardia oceani]MBW0127064.1 ABC transporter substrate-binding protein [Pseudonocardia oceani]
MALSVALVLTACGGDDGGSDRNGEFRITGVLPLTGALGPVGTPLLSGLQAQAMIVNQDGGILGRRVVVDIRDSASDAQRSVAAMREVLADPASVDAIVAEATGSLNAAVLAVVDSTEIVSVTSGSTGADTTEDVAEHPFSFSFASTAAADTRATLQAVAATGATRIGLVNPADDTGRAVDAGMAAAAAEYGLQVVGRELLDPSGRDYTTQLQLLRAAGAEVLTGNLKGTPIGVLTTGLVDLGWNDAQIVGTLGWGSSPLAELVPAEVQPRVRWTGAMAATRTDGMLSDAQTRFIEAIRATDGDLSSITASSVGGDMVLALKYAFESAGEMDQVAARDALERLGDDPAAAEIPWLFFVGQGPRFGPDAHDASRIDPALQYALNVIGEPVDGTYEGTRLTGPAGS